VPVDGSDAGVVDGEEEPSDDSDVVVEKNEEADDDGPVLVEDDVNSEGVVEKEEGADNDGPVAEEDEDVGRVAEQDQVAGVGRAVQQDPDDNRRLAELEQDADGDRVVEEVVVVPGSSAAEAIAAGPPPAAAATVKDSSEARSALPRVRRRCHTAGGTRTAARVDAQAAFPSLFFLLLTPCFFLSKWFLVGLPLTRRRGGESGTYNGGC
jgi:hypothetical protein